MTIKLMHRSTQLQHSSELNVDIKNRTVPIIWSTGAKVLRKRKKQSPDEEDSFFYEELLMTREAIDLSELNSGAPVLLDHFPQTTTNTVGVIVENSADVVDGKGIGLARFASDPISDASFTKVNEKIITKLSNGYAAKEGEWITRKDNELYDTLLITRWKPFEVSLVAFPADNGAVILRNNENDEYDLSTIKIRGASALQIKNEPQNVAKTTNENNSLNIAEITRSERKRINDIKTAVRVANLPDSFAEEFIEKEFKITDVREEIFKELEKRSTVNNYIPHITGGNPVENLELRNKAITDALLHRYSPDKFKLDESSNRFRSLGLFNIAKIITNSDDYTSENDILTRALTTSDFPNLMANIANRTLRKDYELAERTYKPITKETDVNDFRPVTRVQTSDISPLVKRAENGKYREGRFGDASESYAIEEYGRTITITRKMLINDDLGAILDLPTKFANRAAELESDVAWAAFTDQKLLMGDGIPLFHEKHCNYIQKGKGTIFSPTSIAEAVRMMRNQKGLVEGNDKPIKLNIQPYYLIIPTTLEFQALQFVHGTSPTKDQDTNPYKSKFNIIVEPRLDEISETAWYLASNISKIDLIEIAYLKGQKGAFMESKPDFDTDGIRLKCRLDVGAKAIDWRGFFKNEGK